MKRQTGIILISTAVLIVGFQNFAPISTSANLIEAGRVAPLDIRDLAPDRPDGFSMTPDYATEAHFVAPTGADSMESLGSKWVEREMRPLIEPYEKRWVANVNRRLDRFFRFEPVESEDWPDAAGEEGAEGGSRRPATPDGMPELPQMPQMPESPDDTGSFSIRSFRPKDMRLTKANELTLNLANRSSLSCELDGRQSVIKFTRPISDATSWYMSHESAENKNSVNFKYAW